MRVTNREDSLMRGHNRSWQLAMMIMSMTCVLLPCRSSLTAEDVTTSARLPSSRPNIVLIMADDLGFSDLGCYGGEIATPNLDRLAKNGLRYTQFYNTARCWPTRAALLTGYYAQQVRRDTIPGIKSGGRGTRPKWAPLLSVYLRQAGYRCYHTGKWHLDGMPLGNGFDRSYYLRDQHRFFNPSVHYLDDVKLPKIERGTGFYGTTELGNRAVEFLQQHQREHKGQPFFHYLAFTAPHFPLHALPEDIKKYSKTYSQGWQAVRSDRYQRVKKLGIVSSQLSAVELEVGPPYDFPDAIKKLGAGEVNRPLPWQDLTPVQQTFQAAKMAVHAAMVDCLDQQVGRVINQLKLMNIFDNTLILFLSDNGASAEIMVRGDGHDPHAAPGSAASHLCLGPGWSNCSNTPFRRHKTWVHEGGIATPLIVHWPQGIHQKNSLRRTVGHVVDIVPTLIELAHADRHATLKKRKAKPATDSPGRSLVTSFSEEVDAIHNHLWWLHEGNRAIREGDWKLVAAKGQPWELFNLANDRTETTNLANKYPERVKALAALWDAQFASIKTAAATD